MDRDEQIQAEYKHEIMSNKKEYPNLYALETRRNQWKFKKQ